MKISIPIVRICGWRSGNVSPSMQKVVGRILSDGAEYDNDELASKLKRLRAGRSVTIEFDTGDEDAARAFMQRLEGVGLRSTLHSKSFKYHMYHGGFEFFGYLTLRFILPAIVFLILAEPWLGFVFCAIGVGALVSAFLIRVMINRANRTAELLEHFDERTRAG